VEIDFSAGHYFFCLQGLKLRIFFDWDVRGRATSGRGNPFFVFEINSEL
jgi:hypothetical protein